VNGFENGKTQLFNSGGVYPIYHAILIHNYLVAFDCLQLVIYGSQPTRYKALEYAICMFLHR